MISPIFCFKISALRKNVSSTSKKIIARKKSFSKGQYLWSVSRTEIDRFPISAGTRLTFRWKFHQGSPVPSSDLWKKIPGSPLKLGAVFFGFFCGMFFFNPENIGVWGGFVVWTLGFCLGWGLKLPLHSGGNL